MYYVLRMIRQSKKFILTIICVIGMAYIITGCTPAPIPRPDTRKIERQRQVEVDMERLTAEWAYQQGLQSLHNENYPDAVSYFQLTLARDAMHLRAYLSLGDVYTMQDEYLLAESYYNKVLRYDPESVPAFTALANMQVKIGNYRDALTLYRKVLEFEPENHFALRQIEGVTEELFSLYYEQGIVYKESGDNDLALNEFQKAHALNDSNIKFTVEVGYLFLQERDYIMADRYFQQALTRDSNYYLALVGAGKVQLALKRYNKAMEYFRRGMGLHPEGNDEAMEYFKHEMRLQPKEYEVAELLKQTQSRKIKELLPSQYTQILRKEQVNRGDVAAQVMVELMLENRLQPTSQLAIISDITIHWAKPYIIKIVQFGIMELPPDRFFRPNEPIAKGELAFVLDTLFEKLFISLPDSGTVSFSDVHQDNAYHDAVIRIYSAGLMYAASDDIFGLLDPISGEDMAQILKRVKPMIR